MYIYFISQKRIINTTIKYIDFFFVKRNIFIYTYTIQKYNTFFFNQSTFLVHGSSECLDSQKIHSA